MPEPTSRLLFLPQEIKDKIWEYAFGNADIPLYQDSFLDMSSKYVDFTDCEACSKSSLSTVKHGLRETDQTTLDNSQNASDACARLKREPHQRYNDHLNGLIINRSIFHDSLKLFQSTLTLHLKSSEAIAYVRHSAPESLRRNATKLALYIHFDHSNHFLWCSRLLELHQAFPNLKQLRIKYHMRPPISYDNLLDALYLSIPILGLNAPFNRPKFVCSQDAPLANNEDYMMSHGTAIQTTYVEHQALFDADFLGEVTTSDAIDEHTSVIRSLFHDGTYITAAQMVLRSNQQYIQESVARSFLPYQYPQHILDSGFQNLTYLPNVQQTLLQIARTHEKPWFEKLMRRRVVEVWVDHGRSREEIEQFLSVLPEGQGIEDIVEAIMENEDMASLFGFEPGE